VKLSWMSQALDSGKTAYTNVASWHRDVRFQKRLALSADYRTRHSKFSDDPFNWGGFGHTGHCDSRAMMSSGEREGIGEQPVMGGTVPKNCGFSNVLTVRCSNEEDFRFDGSRPLGLRR
jgi:hypothetical protein